MTDRKLCLTQGLGFGVKQVQTGASLLFEGLQQRRQRLLALAFVAPKDQGVERTVAERMPAQGAPFGQTL